MLRRDNLQLGIVLGFIGPILGVVIYYFVVFYEINVRFIDFLILFKENKTLLTGVSSLSLMANAVLFTIYINSRRDRTAKGIFLATLIYGIGVLLVKVIK